MPNSKSNRRNSGRSRSSQTVLPNDFSKLLEAARLTIPGLTQADVALALNKNIGSISHWETGRSFPSKSDAEKLETLVKVDLMTTWHRVNEQRKAVMGAKRRSTWHDREKKALAPEKAEVPENSGGGVMTITDRNEIRIITTYRALPLGKQKELISNLHHIELMLKMAKELDKAS